ncbi:NRAMP-like transporter smf-3 [Aspergillus fumigatus]
MNCPSRTDDTLKHPGWNQNPPALNADMTTRNDLNGIANSKVHRRHASGMGGVSGEGIMETDSQSHNQDCTESEIVETKTLGGVIAAASGYENPQSHRESPRRYTNLTTIITSHIIHVRQSLAKFARFVGPGFLIAVAYIDPGNYATDVAAGAEFRYALLFIVLLSNLFAIFLQSLCIKLGSVVGSAIALNLLLKIPLVAGCAITLADVLFLLIFYRPNGSIWGLRLFEYFVMALVLGVVVCFCIQLSLIREQSVRDVFRGYLPSSAIVQSKGLYQSCGILGATVMPHSIFLGSGVVQPRLKEFDVTKGYVDPAVCLGSTDGKVEYRPSIHAIRGCMKYSIIELSLSLFTFALFVNSSILIVAGASLYGSSGADNADLWGIHDLLSSSIAPVAGLIFALALLLSGISAGIVCTMAGQMVSEGMLKWTIRPWLRRLITRSISIIPSIIIAAAVGKDGLDKTLTASQVVLSVILPFVTAPLIYFTCRNRYMTVPADRVGGEEADNLSEGVKMRNNFLVSALALLIWLVIAVMNVALLVLVGLGKA